MFRDLEDEQEEEGIQVDLDSELLLPLQRMALFSRFPGNLFTNYFLFIFFQIFIKVNY